MASRTAKSGTTGGGTVPRQRTSKNSNDFPIFNKYAAECEQKDGYWFHFFKSLTGGKFPKGVSTKNNFLIYRIKRKPAKMLELPPPEEWEKVAEFFRENCKMGSERDWDEERDKENVEVELTTTQINQLKKKERLSIIPLFALELSKRYGLTSSEMLDLESNIRYHFNQRTFKETDIERYPNGNIKDINILVFDEATRTFNVTRETKVSTRETRENYLDTRDYLFGRTHIKRSEKRQSFDDEIKKYLKLVYGFKAGSGGTVNPSGVNAGGGGASGQFADEDYVSDA